MHEEPLKHPDQNQHHVKNHVDQTVSPPPMDEDTTNRQRPRQSQPPPVYNPHRKPPKTHNTNNLTRWQAQPQRLWQ